MRVLVGNGFLRPLAVAALLSAGLPGASASAGAASIRVSEVTMSGSHQDITAELIDPRSGRTWAANAGSDTAVPAGRYLVGAYIVDHPTLTVAVRSVEVSGPTSVVFDTGKAHRVAFNVGDSSVETTGLAVVPFVSVAGKDRAFVPDNGIEWPPLQTFVLPDPSAKGVRLGVHGVLTKPGTDHGPTRYDVVHSFTGMPADTEITTNRKAMARVDLDVATLDPDQSAFLRLVGQQPDGHPIVGTPIGAGVLGHQVNYRTAGLQWGTHLSMNSIHSTAFLDEDHKDHKLLYAAGKTYRESWGYGVWGPRPAAPAIFVQNGTLHVGGGAPICDFGGSGVHLTDCQVQPQGAHYRLLRDGRVLGEGDSVTARVDDSSPHWYTAELSASRQNEGTLSTTVAATWYFQAGGTSETKVSPNTIVRRKLQVQPGMIRISPAGQDERNRVVGSAPTRIDLEVLEFGDVAAVTLEWSRDGGKTWRAGRVTGAGTHWTTTVPAPGAQGTVSLRVSAKSKSGARVDQTVIDAYGVR